MNVPIIRIITRVPVVFVFMLPLLAFTGFFVFQLYDFWNEHLEYPRVFREGTPISGTIVEVFQSNGSEVTYTFSTPDGQVIARKTFGIPDSNLSEVGEKIAIVYDPHNPKRSYAVAERETDWRAGMAITGAFAAFGLTFVVVIIIGAIKVLRRSGAK